MGIAARYAMSWLIIETLTKRSDSNNMTIKIIYFIVDTNIITDP